MGLSLAWGPRGMLGSGRKHRTHREPQETRLGPPSGLGSLWHPWAPDGIHRLLGTATSPSAWGLADPKKAEDLGKATCTLHNQHARDFQTLQSQPCLISK